MPCGAWFSRHVRTYGHVHIHGSGVLAHNVHICTRTMQPQAIEFAAPTPPPPLLTPVCRRLGFSIGVYPGLESDGSYLRSVGVLSGGCVSLLGPSVSEEYAYMIVVTPQTSQ